MLNWKGLIRVIESNFWFCTGPSSSVTPVPESIVHTHLELCQGWCCDSFLASLCQCPAILWVKSLFVISKPPLTEIRPFPQVLLLITAEISACPSSSPHEQIATRSPLSIPFSRLKRKSALGSGCSYFPTCFFSISVRTKPRQINTCLFLSHCSSDEAVGTW